VTTLNFAGGTFLNSGVAAQAINRAVTQTATVANSLLQVDLGQATTITGAYSLTGSAGNTANALVNGTLSTTGDITVGTNSTFRGSGTVSMAATTQLIVNNGGTIRAGNSIGTLTITGSGAGTTVNVGNSASGATITTEVAATGSPTTPGNVAANSSFFDLTGANDVFNLNAGAANTFNLTISDPGSTLSLDGSNYIITIARVATAGNIQLNGATQVANTTIAATNYNLGNPSFVSSISTSQLFIDSTGTLLQLSFTTTPEPHHVLLVCVGVLLLGMGIRRKVRAAAAC